MAEHYPERGKVFVLGEHGLRHAVSEAGFTLTEDPFAAQFAVCAVHFSLTYDMLADATLAIRNGATFIGTNIDASFPSERGKVPGSGSILALLEVASGVKPIVIGKPYPGMFEQAMARLGSDPASTLMVGDRYETDIVGAIALGLTTVGVTTGVTTPEAFAQADPPPDYVLAGIPELHRLFLNADGKG
jgi:4-nitrophenyl phosphatase